MQPQFLLSLLRACRAVSIHTALDTCGYAPWRSLERIAPEVNLFLYDVKLLDEDRHRAFTGVSNRLILSNLRRLSALGVPLIIRHPLIPGINDDMGSLRMLGEFLTGLHGLLEIEIMPYHPIAEAKYEGLGQAYKLPGLKTPTPDELTQAIEILRGFGLPVKFLAINQSILPEVSDDDFSESADLTPTIAAGC
jgi:pyruvate formate lyase activating enzyme